jgi:uncharacterized metal-binding protein
MTSNKNEKPLVYSCSGCSNAAQMANYLALRLDRSGVAEMSCIAGVGGNVKKLVQTALSGRKIIVIDGCPLACSRACLANHSVQPDQFFDLSEFGIKKEFTRILINQKPMRYYNWYRQKSRKFIDLQTI